MADHILADLGGPIRTFPELSDLQAAHNPDRPWTVFVSPSNPEEIASLTFKQLADGSHTVAHILRPGRKGPEDEVIALLLHTDVVLYVPVFLGCLRAGLVVSTSPLAMR
jgi:acyl-CoA synthetase (AMP-forming)/AMP-acid ligase II